MNRPLRSCSRADRSPARPLSLLLLAGLAALAGCPDPAPSTKPPPPKLAGNTPPPPPTPPPTPGTAPTPPPTPPPVTPPPRPRTPPTPPAPAPPPVMAGHPLPSTSDQLKDLLRAAYSLRRQGHLTATCAAFESLVERMPRGDAKRDVAAELVSLYRVMGTPDRALQVYRRNHDFEGEFAVLFEMNRTEEALTVARLVKYPPGEAEALARMGKVDDALRILQGIGAKADPDRARLLAKSGRNVEAAELYGRLNDFYSQAQALEAAHDAQGARHAYDDAKLQVMDQVRDEKKAVERAQDLFQRAPDGVRREHARLKLAERLARAADAYEHLALVYSRTGQAPDKTSQLAQNAVRYVELQRDTLTDQGGDAYGVQCVAQLKLAERIAALQQKAREYAAAPPAPAPAGPPRPGTPATPPPAPPRGTSPTPAPRPR